MNLKVPAKLKLEEGKFLLYFQDRVIEMDSIGWISKQVDIIFDHSPREFYEISEEDLILIIEDDGNCYLEIKEVRNMATKWEGSAINSYTTEDPLYREEIALIENKMILHFYKKEEEKNE